MGIPPAPRGMPQIEVAFDIDANGIVNVSAKDLATGKEQEMTITGGTALSKDDIDRMVKDAEEFAAEDHKRREAAEARNTADNLTYQVDKALVEYGRQGPEADEKRVTEGERRAEGGPEGRRTSDADQVDHRGADAGLPAVGQAMYAAAAGAEAAAGGGRRTGARRAKSRDERRRRRRGRDRRRGGRVE